MLSKWLVEVIIAGRHRQQARTLSILLSIERSRSDEICRFCPIRQLGPSLYLERFLTHGFRSLPERFLSSTMLAVRRRSFCVGVRP